MTRTDLVNQLDIYARERDSRLPKAVIVVAFCEQQNIACRLSPKALEIAMKQMPYWQQGLSNYLDFVFGYEAAYAMCSARKTEKVGVYNAPFVVSG